MNIIKHHWNSLLNNPWQAKYVVPILAVNSIGSVYGYYWYAGQLASTAKKLWLFVPDSPLATTLFTAVLVLSLAGFRSVLLSVVAFTACIKYGLWAVIVISDFWIGGGGIHFEEAMLWVSHMGMAAQGMVYLRPVLSGLARQAGGREAGLVAAAACWMFLNDFMDYYLGIYPYLYVQDQEFLASVSAVALSVALLALMAFKVANNRL
jgi:uncharacterized membrane protein YpjA